MSNEVTSTKKSSFRLTKTATSQSQNQSYVLAHPNIHPICDLLVYRAGGGGVAHPRL